MTTKRSPRSERKRTQILDAAGDLFISNGYFETSMDDIAGQAGVSKQTVYAHFGSKDDLFTYCVEHKCAEVELAPMNFAADLKPQQQLLQFCLGVGDVMQSAEALYVMRLCVSQAETHPQLSHSFYAAGPGRLLQQLADGLTQLAQQSDWAIPDPFAAAEQLMVLTKGMVGLRRDLGIGDEDEPQRQQRIEQAVNLFCRAYQRQGS
ncbi:TetR/AcrR family transcriptional regulator [uncultured Ferrimonas sp.]|uniref:TetR/AcrR family transcriptional regulator n=1 Tax=uncultured Ferrimonas sp. TaxID=432640 RepID=UPI002602613A|nr:TetR/AcrR family transcriptional regulator [uncultured Ferrimonas sp.]